MLGGGGGGGEYVLIHLHVLWPLPAKRDNFFPPLQAQMSVMYEDDTPYPTIMILTTFLRKKKIGVRVPPPHPPHPPPPQYSLPILVVAKSGKPQGNYQDVKNHFKLIYVACSFYRHNILAFKTSLLPCPSICPCPKKVLLRSYA